MVGNSAGSFAQCATALGALAGPARPNVSAGSGFRVWLATCNLAMGRHMTDRTKAATAACLAALCLLLAMLSFGLASAKSISSHKWAWSGTIAEPPNNSPKLLHQENTHTYTLVCVDSHTPPAAPLKFTTNGQSQARFNKAGCWLDALTDIYLAEGSASGTITGLGPTTRKVRPLHFNFSNVAGEESDLVGIPSDQPVNVKICIEQMEKAGQIKFTIKYYGDEPAVDRWEIPQFPINPKHLDCPEFNHIVAIWLDHGDGEANANSIPISGTVYVN
jgi:hypothetical protein